MTVLQKKSDNPNEHLPPEDIELIGKERDDIRQSVIDTRGENDARYIRKVIDVHRKIELGSRAVLLASGFPPAWIVGTIGLSVAKILENMEIGHNIRSEEHTSELQSRQYLVCRLLLEKKKYYSIHQEILTHENLAAQMSR